MEWGRTSSLMGPPLSELKTSNVESNMLRRDPSAVGPPSLRRSAATSSPMPSSRKDTIAE